MELKGDVNHLKDCVNELKGEVGDLKDEVKEGTEELKKLSKLAMDIWEFVSKQPTPLQDRPLQHPVLMSAPSPYQSPPPLPAPLQLVQYSPPMGRPLSFDKDLPGMGQCSLCFSSSC